MTRILTCIHSCMRVQSHKCGVCIHTQVHIYVSQTVWRTRTFSWHAQSVGSALAHLHPYRRMWALERRICRPANARNDCLECLDTYISWLWHIMIMTYHDYYYISWLWRYKWTWGMNVKWQTQIGERPLRSALYARKFTAWPMSPMMVHCFTMCNKDYSLCIMAT